MNRSLKAAFLFGIVLFSRISEVAADDSQVDKIIEQSKRPVAACKSYGDQVAVLREGEKREPGKNLWNIPKDKETARQLIEIAETYPGTDPSVGELKNMVATQGVSNDKLQSVYGCNIMAFFDNYKAIVAGASAYKYSATQKRKITEVFLKKGIFELSSVPILLPSILINNIALQLIDAGIFQVSDPIYLALVQFESRLEALRKKHRDLKNDSNEQMRVEWRETPLVAQELARVLTRIRVR